MAPQVPTWFEMAKPLLDAQVPDNVYDAQRDAYFDAYVKPAAIKAGENVDSARENFRKNSERPDKAKFPRAELLGAAALKGFVAPAKALMSPEEGKDFGKGLDALESRAAREATRQGINPTWYATGGEMLGQLPYWAGGFALAGPGIAAATPAIAGEFGLSEAAVQAGLHAAVGAAIQGSYDAAKADDGHRLQEGLQGAAMGGLTVGAFEAVGPLRNALRARNALSPEVAAAVENTAKGTATDAEQALATQAVVQQPAVEQTVQQWVAEQISAAKKAGLPKNASSVEPGGRVKIQVKTADGKIYNVGGVVGVDVSNIGSLVDRIAPHLDNGGEILSVSGDPNVLNNLYRQFERVNKEKGFYAETEKPAPTPVDQAVLGGGAEAGPAGRVAGEPSLPGGEPTPSAGPATGPSIEWDGETWSPMKGEYSNWWTTESGRTMPEKALMAKAAEDYLPSGGRKAFSRRDILKKLGGGLAGAAMSPEQAAAELPKLQAALQSAQAGGKVAWDFIRDLVEQNTDYSFKGITKEGLLHLGAPRMNSAGNAEIVDILRSPWGALYGSTSSPLDDLLAYPTGMPEAVTQNWLAELKNTSLRVILADAERSGVKGKLESVIGPEAISQLSKINPELPKVIESLKGMSFEDQYDFLYKRLPIEVKAGDKNIATTIQELQTRANVQQANEARLQQQTVTPGMELARTPAALGEEGTGGVMLRYAKTQMSSEEAQARSIGNAPPAGDELRPTYYRQILDNQGPGMEDVAGQTYAPRGSTPRISFTRDELSPQVLFHETLHGHFGSLGLIDDFKLMEQVDKPWRKMVYQMTGGWPEELRADYFKAGAVGEEIYAYTASAVRTNDETMLQRFIEADTSREHVMKWVADTTDTLMQSLDQLPDSVHKRVLGRKLGEVYRRSTAELRSATNDTAAVFGADVDIVNGKYVVKTPEGVFHRFNDRESLAQFLEESYQEPLGAPNLIDESSLPNGVPRFARNIPPHSIGRVPAQTPPPTFEAPGAEQAGASLLSFFVRPFYPWLDTVAKKLERPDLYDAFKALDRGIVSRDSMMAQYEVPLKQNLVGKSLAETKYSPARQNDLYRYMQATGPHKAFVENQLHITPQEKADLASLEANFFDPLAAQTGLDFRKFIQEVGPTIRRTGDPELVKVGGSLTQRDVDFWKAAVYKGEIDPLDTNLLRLSHSYLRLVARDQHIGDALTNARKLIDEKMADGENFRVGTYRPLLQRQLDYIAGRPDYTQRIMDGTVQGAMNLINSGIEQVNKVLPDRLKIEPMDSPPRDVMGRWLLFSYAGGLALRPMVPIRDSLQLLMTTYPMLGGKYTRIGMEKAFPVLREGVEADAYKIADAYGALMKGSDMQNLYSGGYESLASGGKFSGPATRFSEWALKPLQWSNNSNRLVSFWGHAEQVLDAIRETVPQQNVKAFTKKSGLYWLDDNLRDKFVKEAMSADSTKWQDIAFRAAKELTDLSQWNYRRGASPGIYKYAMGRLFGQYGTWPLNYIEYARRLATKGDASDRVAALTKLAIAHGAVLKAGELAGVDTGQWIFTQPMAYGGSPLFQAVVNIPNTMDFESYRGMDARRDVARIFWPMQVPGGLAAERVYKAVTSNSPTALQEALGFSPLKPNEDKKLYHQIIP